MAKHKNNVLRIPTKMSRKAELSDVVSIGFFISNSFSPLSWLIRKVTSTSFSETYFKFRDKKLKEGKVFYTDGINICYSGEKNFNRNNKVVAEFMVQANKQLHIELMNECYRNAGIKHGFLKQIFKPKDRFNVIEWMSTILKDQEPNWTQKETKDIKSKDILEHLSKIDNINN